MKRFLLFAVAICLLTPCAGAEVLADGWQNASLDALIEAQNQISARIEVVKLEDAFANQSIRITGNGTTIVSDPVSIDFCPYRVVVNGAVRVTLTGGSYDMTYNNNKNNYFTRYSDETGDYQMLVEGVGDWSVDIEPLKYGGEIEISGKGPFVSDFFTFVGPQIVTCSIDSTKTDESGQMYLYLGHEYSNISGWGQDEVAWGDYYYHDTATEDSIINNTADKTLYFWYVDVEEGVEWSIKLKK